MLYIFECAHVIYVLVCFKGVDINSIFCDGCFSWVHNRCSGISVPLRPEPGFSWKLCTGQARPVACTPMTEVTVGKEKLEAVPYFCYLRDCLSSQDSVSHGANSMSFCPSSPSAYFPLPPEADFPIRTSGAPCSTSRTWVPTLSCLHRLHRNEQRLWFAGWRVSPSMPK